MQYCGLQIRRSRHFGILLPRGRLLHCSDHRLLHNPYGHLVDMHRVMPEVHDSVVQTVCLRRSPGM